jgi:hypothetical protein
VDTTAVPGIGGAREAAAIDGLRMVFLTSDLPLKLSKNRLFWGGRF